MEMSFVERGKGGCGESKVEVWEYKRAHMRMSVEEEEEKERN